MSGKFSEKMSKAADAQLKEFVEEKSFYQDDFILAALNEMSHRGNLTDEQLKLREAIEQKLNAIRQREKRKQREPFFPPNLASNIKYAAYLLYFSVGLGVINAVVYRSISGVGVRFNDLSIDLPTSALLLIFGVYIQKGKKIARNIFMLYAILKVLVTYSLFSMEPSRIIPVVQSVINLVCLFLLFTRSSRNWYDQ